VQNDTRFSGQARAIATSEML